MTYNVASAGTPTVLKAPGANPGETVDLLTDAASVANTGVPAGEEKVLIIPISAYAPSYEQTRTITISVAEEGGGTSATYIITQDPPDPVIMVTDNKGTDDTGDDTPFTTVDAASGVNVAFAGATLNYTINFNYDWRLGGAASSGSVTALSSVSGVSDGWLSFKVDGTAVDFSSGSIVSGTKGTDVKLEIVVALSESADVRSQLLAFYGYDSTDNNVYKLNLDAAADSYFETTIEQAASAAIVRIDGVVGDGSGVVSISSGTVRSHSLSIETNSVDDISVVSANNDGIVFLTPTSVSSETGSILSDISELSAAGGNSVLWTAPMAGGGSWSTVGTVGAIYEIAIDFLFEPNMSISSSGARTATIMVTPTEPPGTAVSYTLTQPSWSTEMSLTVTGSDYTAGSTGFDGSVLVGSGSFDLVVTPKVSSDDDVWRLEVSNTDFISDIDFKTSSDFTGITSFNVTDGFIEGTASPGVAIAFVITYTENFLTTGRLSYIDIISSGGSDNENPSLYTISQASGVISAKVVDKDGDKTDAIYLNPTRKNSNLSIFGVSSNVEYKVKIVSDASTPITKHTQHLSLIHI